MKIDLPEKVNMIIRTLNDAGFEAYAVGGCIRDSILGRTPSDWDITTSANPQEVKLLFRRTIDTGIRHGTVTVMLDKDSFEVTTYRIDGEYEDGRHPKDVVFTKSLYEDLRRRDFTINAMAYNEQCGLVDAFGGIKDLENQMIRAVGNPKERFTEDALRIMRSVRFAAQLGFSIEQGTRDAAKYLAGNLRKISAERIQTELVKLMVSDHPEFLKTAYEIGITKETLPEFDCCMETEQNHPHHCYTVGEHILKALQHVKAGDMQDEKKLKFIRLALLFHDSGKPRTKTTDDKGIDHFHGHAAVSEEIAGTVLRRLHFDNETTGIVKLLVKYHDYKPQACPAGVRRAVNRVGEEIFPLLLPVMEADIYAQSMYQREEKLSYLSQIRKIYETILRERDCLSIKDLAITGKDLIEAGIPSGPRIGSALKHMLSIVLEEPSCNTKEYLSDYVKQNISALLTLE